MNMTEREANRVYDLLVRLAGASNRALHRELFISRVTGSEESSYIFCGQLGFGGKFLNQHGLWYVSADLYDFNSNPDLAIQISQINAALFELKSFFTALTAATTD